MERLQCFALLSENGGNGGVRQTSNEVFAQLGHGARIISIGS